MNFQKKDQESNIKLFSLRTLQSLLALTSLFSTNFALQKWNLLEASGSSVLLLMGFVLLTSYLVSDLFRFLGFPRVTSYILMGLVLGPFVLNFLSKAVVGEIEMFNNLAVGLIALAAGLEFHFKFLKKVIFSICVTSLFKILFLCIFLVLIFMGSTFFLEEVDTYISALGLAFVFLPLCLGTSPAISLAVIEESQSRGRMSQLILGSSIFKDFLLIILLSLSLWVAQNLLQSHGGTHSDWQVLYQSMGLSVLLGLGIGLLFIFGLRFFKSEVLLFVAITVLATSELARSFHLEILLIFIVAGIVVRNLSGEEEILHGALRKISLPVFILFFTNVGAGLNLESTWLYFPLAVVLFLARGGAFWLSSFWSSWIVAEEKVIQKNVWMGYLPQAGVTLGLLALAVKGLPEQADFIAAVGMGFITLNLILGPIGLKIALKKFEKVHNNERVEVGDQSKQGSSGEEFLKEQRLGVDVDLDLWARDLLDTDLKTHFVELSQRVFEIFNKNSLLPLESVLSKFSHSLEELRNQPTGQVAKKMSQELDFLGRQGGRILETLPFYEEELEKIPLEKEFSVPKEAIVIQVKDSLRVQFSKMIKYPYFALKKNSRRVLPLRKLARYNLEPFLASFTLGFVHSWYRLLGDYIETLQKSLEGQFFFEENFVKGAFSERDLRREIQELNRIWKRNVTSDFCKTFSTVASSWVGHLNKVNTTYLSESRLRYSQISSDVEKNLLLTRSGASRWEEKFAFCRNRLNVSVQISLLTRQMENILEEKFLKPISEVQDRASQRVREVESFFSLLEEKTNNLKDMEGEFQSLHEQIKEFTSQNLKSEIKTQYIRGNFKLLNRDISLSLKKISPKDQGVFEIASMQTFPNKVNSPGEILIKKINLYELFEQNILVNFLPIVEEKMEGVSNYLESLLNEMDQAFSILAYSFDTQNVQREQIGLSEIQREILSSLKSERKKILELQKVLKDYTDQSIETIQRLFLESQMEVKNGVERVPSLSTAKSHFRHKILSVVKIFKNQKSKFINFLRESYKPLKNWINDSSERQIDKVLRRKILEKTLDTSTIRKFIDETYGLEWARKNLSRLYFRLFTLEPIQDHRFFVAHQSALSQMDSLTGGGELGLGEKVLIVGDRGVGKSSLLNIVQMDIKNKNLIRLDNVQKNPVTALARALGCVGHIESVLSVLRSSSQVILMDNIDHCLSSLDVREFMGFIEIVQRSGPKTQWILSITRSNLDVFHKAFEIRGIFTTLIDLNETHKVQDLVLSRHRLSGLDICYPQTPVGHWFMGLGLGGEDTLFFRVLHEHSKGHLRHLVYLWLLSLKSLEGQFLHLSTVRWTHVESGLPMFSEFSLLKKYILRELYNYHHLSIGQLSYRLGVLPTFLGKEVKYLKQCGLIQTKAIDPSNLEIPAHLVYMVGEALKGEEIFSETDD